MRRDLFLSAWGQKYKTRAEDEDERFYFDKKGPVRLPGSSLELRRVAESLVEDQIYWLARGLSIEAGCDNFVQGTIERAVVDSLYSWG